MRLRARLVAGDDDSLAEAYDCWSSLVYTVALRITEDHAAAQDVTQDVFVQLWSRPDRYQPERGALRSWLCMLARSRALDWTRRRRTRARQHAAAAALEPAAHPSADEAIIWQVETQAVRDAVRALPEPQRAVVLLAYYRGRTYRDVARELNIPEGTAKSRLRVALASVAEHLAEHGISEGHPSRR